MKLLAFTDVHVGKKSLESIKEKALKEKPDLLICCGDLSVFGSGLKEAAKFLNDLKIQTLIIPGNHEMVEEVKDICSKYKNLVNLHCAVFELGNFNFFGWGTGGFSFIEEEFERVAKKFIKNQDRNKKLIFVTHAPIYGTKLDYLPMGHRGCKSTRKFVEEVQPLLVLCGHFHENFKKQDKIKKSLIINPGKDGMIIELKENNK